MDRVIATGNTAVVYDIGGGIALKLFREGYPREYVELEYTNSNTLYSLGISTPRAHRITERQGRPGIEYDYIAGISMEKAFLAAADISEQIKLLAMFTEFQQDLNLKSAPGLVDYREYLRFFLRDQPEMMEAVSQLPEGTGVLHGDYHPGNLLLNECGDLVLIDMMNVCAGPKAYDAARTYVLLNGYEDLKEAYLKRMGYSVTELERYIYVIQAARRKGL